MTLLELKPGTNPFELFHEWLSAAKGSEPSDPDAACLATAIDNRPSARMVLVRKADARGFTFYTNSLSRKGRQLEGNPHAALCYHWKSLKRQVRVEGRVEVVDAADSDAYHASRARGSRLSAWASDQSQPLDSRETFLARVAALEQQYDGQDVVPRPPHWHGYRIIPDYIEFWQEGLYRMHDRFIFTVGQNDAWHMQRLYP